MNYLKRSQKSFPLNLAKVIIFIYHGIFPSKNRVCRFEPTCSQYLLEALQAHGALKGSYISAKRLLACHPLSSRNLFDPVP